MHNNRFSIYRNPARRAVEVYFYQKQEGGKIGVGKYIEMGLVDELAPADPLVFLDDEGATELLQELWDQGFRPHNYEGADAIAAVKRHLEDMRRIAFRFLEKE